MERIKETEVKKTEFIKDYKLGELAGAQLYDSSLPDFTPSGPQFSHKDSRFQRVG